MALIRCVTQRKAEGPGAAGSGQEEREGGGGELTDDGDGRETGGPAAEMRRENGIPIAVRSGAPLLGLQFQHEGKP
jgi:hypothetical protein